MFRRFSRRRNKYEFFYPSQPDPLVFKMTSKIIEGQETFSRDEFNDYYKYNKPTTEHIFIYGPITDNIYENIEKNMLKHYSNNTQLIIHLQGENFLNNQGRDGETFLEWNLKEISLKIHLTIKTV